MDDESLSKANKAVEQRLAAQELRIAKLELHRAQLSVCYEINVTLCDHVRGRTGNADVPFIL